MDLQTAYKILEIQETASLPEIKQAYRDMIGIWHPDRYVQNPRLHEKATEKLKAVNVAYNELITRLTSGIVKSPAGSRTPDNNTHLLIVTCPGCQKKNRIKAGYVTHHPRCGVCGILLFQKKQPRQTGRKTRPDTDTRSGGNDQTDQTSAGKTFHSKTAYKEAPVSQTLYPKRKRRFWNKWTLLLSIAVIGVVIANADNIRYRLTQGFQKISEGRYIQYFKDPSQTPGMKNNTATASADILQIQKSLKNFGYGIDPLDGIWGDQTLTAVQQFRKDYFLEFRAGDISELSRAMQRQRAIIKLHPDWQQIAKDGRFNSWIDQQIMTSPKICRSLLATGKIQQVGSLIGWYKFHRLQPKTVSMPRSGTIKKGYHKGSAPLTIQTRNDGRHYYLKLIDASNGSEILSAFIRGGSTFVEHVPVGKYELKYAVGDVWYGTRWLFGPKTVFRKMDRVFEFKIHKNEIAGYRLELYLQPTALAQNKKDFAFDF